MAIRRKTYKGIYTDENEVFVCDTASDLSLLPTDAPQGSSAFVIDDSTTHMIDSSGVWNEVQIGASGGGGDIILGNLSVTENGVYTPDSGHAYKKVTVAVEDVPDPDPTDGKTHVWARIDEDTPDERKEFTLAWSQSVSNGVEVDWGDSRLIVDTLSGPVVSFSGDVSVKSLAASIEPVQSGSGDPSPSNVRPISGWTGAVIRRTGKNLAPLIANVTRWGMTFAQNDDGTVSVSGTSETSGGRTVFRSHVTDNFTLKAGTYTFHVTDDSDPAYGSIHLQTGTSIMYSLTHTSPSVTFTLANDMSDLYVGVNVQEGTTYSGKLKYQIEAGNAATEWEPYSKETFEVTFPTEAGTVYGGVLDLTAGTLTVDRARVDLGSLSYNVVEMTNNRRAFYFERTYLSPSPAETRADKSQNAISSAFKVTYQNASKWNVGEFVFTVLSGILPSNSVGFIVDASEYENANDFRTSMTGQDLVYELASPIIYQLAPVQIATLLGTNNVWADTGDMTVKIEYYDIKTVPGTGAVSLTHRYENGGEYEITMDAIEGTISFTGTSGTAGTSIYGSKANARCYNRQRITRISIGANAEVGSYMAHYCYGLSRVGLPQTLTSIGAHAFEECFSLPSIEIPSGVTSIGEYAFSYCHSLESADIPDSVVSIGAYAFRNCYGLREIDFPSGLTSISDYTYQGCYNLTSIDIPNTVTSIGNGAFHSCYGLTSVRIPAAVRSIGDSAFLNCYGVSEYHIGATTPPTLASTNAFTGMASDCVIYVPRSTNQTVLNAYKAATNWVTYASRMQEEAE